MKNSGESFLAVLLNQIFSALGLIFAGPFRITMLALTIVGGLVIQWIAIRELGFTNFFDLWSPVPLETFWQLLTITTAAMTVFLLVQVFLEKPPVQVAKTGNAFAVTGVLANTCWFIIVILLFFATST